MWSLLDDPVTNDDIEWFKSQEGGALEFFIVQRFLTRQELSQILKNQNKLQPRNERVEYYDFLASIRCNFCVPAMQDVIAGTFATLRAAVLDRLHRQGML